MTDILTEDEKAMATDLAQAFSKEQLVGVLISTVQALCRNEGSEAAKSYVDRLIKIHEVLGGELPDEN